MKSKIMTITIALALVLTLVFAVAGPVSASPSWNVSGNWVFNFLEGATVVSTYNVTLAQTGTALTGTGEYPTSGPIVYGWTITGAVTNGIDFTATYTTTPTLGYPGPVTLSGTIAPDGTMSGNWSQASPAGSGTWQTTSGQATQIANNGGAPITGDIVAPTISMTAPGAIDFGQFTFGVPDQKGPMAGTVTVVLNSANSVNWVVTATDAAAGNGYMWTSGYGAHLTDPLYILVDGVNWNYANVNAAVTGSNNGGFSFYAKQTAEVADAATTYYDTVTFSVAITGEN